MASERGIDIFEVYQTVTDWQAIKNSGVHYGWIKATNGMSIARYNAPTYRPAPADRYVNGMRSVGIAPGIYHYALPGDPQEQAKFFATEVDRLSCKGSGTTPPALDAEEMTLGVTWADRRLWSKLFLLRLQREIEQERVALYANATWHVSMRTWEWDIPGLVLWVAAYGANDGDVHGIVPWPGPRVDVHQFTSSGTRLVNGVTGSGLDVNELRDMSLATLLGEGEDDLSGYGANLAGFVYAGGPSTRVDDAQELQGASVDPTSLFGRVADVQWALTRDLPAIKEQLAKQEEQIVAMAATITELKEQLGRSGGATGPTKEDIAAAVVAELKKEGN
jgi:GH25 family lysozyme M1 (1,4-beta-N-acetylmuramidase)